MAELDSSGQVSAQQQDIRRVGIVGAGMVGLSTAWFLQEQGVEVTILDRTGVAAGSSWGNAGWLTPSMAVPLPEPSVLRYGLKALVSPSSPVYVPPTADPHLMRFLLKFARNCTMPRWKKAMAGLIPLNNRAQEAFDAQTAGGVASPVKEAQPFTAAYRTEAEREGLLEEFRAIEQAGQKVDYELLTGEQARAAEPALSAEVRAAIKINRERYIDPAAYVNALANSVVERGGTLLTRTVTSITSHGAGGASLLTGTGEERFDAVVVASGAHLNLLAREYGVRQIVQAGRGYSFTVATDHLPRGPVYFPVQRLACTPLENGRLRIAGMMEFRPADAPLDPRRIQALVKAGQSLLAGADLQQREDEWVGARPCTADGLPLIGRTRAERVYVAGGHGMWGITLGPLTGQLLAEEMLTGVRPVELRATDPLR